MALITRQSKGDRLTITELDGNFTYLESLVQQGGVGPQGQVGPQGTEGLEGQTGPQGPVGQSSGGSVGTTYSLVLYFPNQSLFNGQIEPVFMTQSFEGSFLQADLDRPFEVFGVEGLTQSVLFEGVYKTASNEFSQLGTTVSLQSESLSGVFTQTAEQSFTPGQSIFYDITSDLNYNYLRSLTSDNETVQLNYAGSSTKVSYSYQTSQSVSFPSGDPQTTHYHLLRSTTPSEDYFAEVLLTEIGGTLSSTYSVTVQNYVTLRGGGR